MTASISDVAARAGVSVATVSRALRDLPNVAPSTRERVLRAAGELEYVADPNAARLATGQTRAIGMVVPLFTQWFFTQCVAGAETVLTAAGYDVLLYNISGTASRERFLDDLPFRKRVDGIIVIDLPLADAELERLGGSGVPIVTVGLHSERFPSVSIDNMQAAEEACRHLVELDHQRIGLISNLPDDPLQFTAPLERRQGYQAALLGHGIAVHPELDVPGNFSVQGGAEAIERLLGLDDPPTAVFAESDEMAIGALKGLKDRGVPVPEEFSVVGFDDHDMAEYVGLTTVLQPVVAQGEVAAGLLLEQMQPDEEEAHEPRRVVMPTRLVVRSTTGRRNAVREPVGSP